MKAAQVDQRNAKVVVALFGALTIGAGLLLWMEPRYAGIRTGTPLLMMQGAATFESLEIEFLEAGRRFATLDYDCLIPAEGELVWNPQGTALRLLVVGQKDRLTNRQARQLNELISNLQQNNGLDPANVRLAHGSDPRTSRAVPVGAQEMAALLRRNGMIQ